MAHQITNAVVHRLPDDYHDTYRDRIRAVTAEEAAEAGRRHIRPGELQLVVVGDAEGVRGSLEALELGPVEVVEATE